MHQIAMFENNHVFAGEIAELTAFELDAVYGGGVNMVEVAHVGFVGLMGGLGAAALSGGGPLGMAIGGAGGAALGELIWQMVIK